MFTKTHMSVGDWFLFHILMAIPIVNIVFFILILVNPLTTKSLKNYMIYYIVITVIMVALLFVIFMPLMDAIIDALNEMPAQ